MMSITSRCCSLLPRTVFVGVMWCGAMASSFGAGIIYLLYRVLVSAGSEWWGFVAENFGSCSLDCVGVILVVF